MTVKFKYAGRRNQDRLVERYRELLHSEATLGGQLFGPVPDSRRREFFCLDAHTWVWHEEWTDESGQHYTKTTRYDVRPDAILKAQDGLQYQPATDDEILNLANAAELYAQRVDRELYHVSNQPQVAA